MASDAQVEAAEAEASGGCGWTALISGWEVTPTLLTVKNCGGLASHTAQPPG
jgi:hypothetical protein